MYLNSKIAYKKNNLYTVINEYGGSIRNQPFQDCIITGDKQDLFEVGNVNSIGVSISHEYQNNLALYQSQDCKLCFGLYISETDRGN
jgi:hypothetical protein